MTIGFKAIELEGAVDEQHRLHLDVSLPDAASGPVRILVLIPDLLEPTEPDWARAVATNPVFEFLHDPAEDIYSPTDGKPFHDQG